MTRQEREMLRRLEELDRLDALAGGVGKATVPYAYAPPPRRRSWGLTTVLMGLLVVGLTTGLVQLRKELAPRMQPVIDAYVPPPVTTSDRPTGISATSLTRVLPHPEPPPGEGGYAFVRDNGDGPAAYDPCRPVKFVMVEEFSVPGAENLLTEALAAATRASGTQLLYEGPTNETASMSRQTMDKYRYGDRWSPVLVSFTTPDRIPRLQGRTVGIGGSSSVEDDEGTLLNVTGLVYLDGPAFRQVLAGDGGHDHAVAIITHELGHVLGLGHVDDPSQLMAPENTGQVGFGDGDLRGLAVLADRPCQFGL